MNLVSKDKSPFPNPSFPIELIEAVIDHNHDDKDSLQACSLVARQWLPTSRLHLIPEIKVNQENCRQLLELLENPFCRLPLSVRMLKLANILGDPQHNWIGEALPALSNHFSSIIGFSMERFTLIPPETLALLHSAFPKVESLDLTNCIFLDSESHTNLLSSFGIAKTIKSEGCYYSASRLSNEYPLPNHRLSLMLRQMTIDGDDHSFMRWLEDQDFPYLERFSTGLLHIQNVIRASRIISRSGTSLRFLHFQFGHDFMPTKIDDPRIDLSHNTSLEEITVWVGRSYVHMPPDMGINSEISSFLIAMFSSISSKVLHTINLHLYIRTPERLEEIDWVTIDSMANKQPWGKNLKRFIIHAIDISSNTDYESDDFCNFMDETTDTIASGLANITERQILAMQFYSYNISQDRCHFPFM